MNIMAKPIPPEVVDTFYLQMDGLEMDPVRAAQRSAKRAWRVAGCALSVTVLLGFAIASLAPIHTVEWRLVRVDNAGPVEVVTTLDKAGQVVSLDDANAKTYLFHYVRLRESYAVPEISYNFRAVSLMTSKDTGEQQRYQEFVNRSPDSPQKRFGRDGREVVTIESVVILNKDPPKDPKKWLGQVDFSREEYKDKGGVPERTHWRATIGFEFHPWAKMKDSDRLINPVGFQVMSYNIDPVTK